jgi:hypothetical protein
MNLCKLVYNPDEIICTIVLAGTENKGEYFTIEMKFPSEKEKEMTLYKHTRAGLIVYIMEGTFLIKYGNENINGITGHCFKIRKKTSIMHIKNW